MPFHFHDTLTGQDVPLPARTPGETSLYVCGPTVYNLIHVGNARPAVIFDVLVRHLRASGLKVTFVRNFTDVDDKIIKAAVEANEEPRALAQRYVEAYLADTGALNCRRPDAEPRVSDHLPEIVAMIEALIANGHAYARDGDVYYSVRTFTGYGKLSKRDLGDLRAGERVAIDERKDDPLDFALWKAAKPHEPPGARWASPWGEGRPGWHIECSAMSRKILGDGFDLHGGGMDLIFPHHENEIAQSEAATGCTFARGWMHNGFINIDDMKLSKSTMASLGWRKHFFILRNLLEHVDPEAVRLWLLGTHYRAPLNLEITGEETTDGVQSVHFPGIEEAERRVEYFMESRARLNALVGRPPGAASAWAAEKVSALRQRFDEALDKDLNTSGALAPFGEAFRRANELCDAGKKGADEARALATVIDHMTSVLGVAESDPERFIGRVHRRRVSARGLDPAAIDQLLVEREAARKARDFARADTIRNDLLSRGVEIRDTPGGASTWRAV